MKKYLICSIFFVGSSFCAVDTSNFTLQFLFTQLETFAKNTLQNFQKPSSTGRLLGDIAQGTKLKKVPKPEEKKPVKGGLQSVLGESDLLKKAEDFSKGQQQSSTQGASEEEWEESEKRQSSAPVVPTTPAPTKPVKLPQLPKNVLGSNVPDTPKPLTQKSTTPTPSVPVKTTVTSGNLLSQIAGTGQSQLKPAVKASAETAALDFNKMTDDKIIEAVTKHKDAINQFSLKQLLDIGADKDVLDELNPDIVDALKQAARSKKVEADAGQQAALRWRYSIK